MKTLIVYGTKYGCTERCARVLAEELPEDVALVNLEQEKVPSLQDFSGIIIGTPVYAGRVRKAVLDFIDGNLETLTTVKLGLFVCCADSEGPKEQLKKVMPVEFMDRVKVFGYFGYELQFDRMRFIERLAIRFIMKTTENRSELSRANIRDFARRWREES